ncbi:acyl-CoA dehydrogenase [Bosea sp. (in: a-proteobacteria)]|uniref:acyl-CoA dehydrogenase family protein n=1 Tax=Bosea sp. (in: a-proteobacteria) TaxID=1871050 RepID=UPI00261AF3F1|nr:acyl-CoA dehydrogenase [Bosea sp. (in: a-proteobacteria)]MCO5089546.1 acyl-CoA dehydrogenase [Bosea sp. (in: a-proteobacteria)]
MRLEPSEEQVLLKDMLGRLLQDRYGFEQRRQYGREPAGFSDGIWAAYAELGLLGIGFSEEEGGIGGGAAEVMIVAERLGAHLTLEPWIETVVTAGSFLRRGGSAGQCAARIPAIVAGGHRMSFAQAERQSRYTLHDVTTTATRVADGWLLDGEKIHVVNADSAGEFIVTARISGNRRDRDGIAVFMVGADTPGVGISPYATVDGRRAGIVRFGGVAVSDADRLGEAGEALPLVEAAVDETLAAQAAEALGSMQAALDMTVEYVKARTQFGRPIGSFQVVQHRASEMLAAAEQARSMVLLSAMMARCEARDDRRRAISAAKVELCRAARFIGEQAVQLHGGIGLTMEYAVGHHLKHLKALEVAYGDGDHHLQALVELGGPFAGE